MTPHDYIDRLNTRYKTGISREHSYRGDLQNLLETLCPGILVTNEPAQKWLKDRKGRELSFEDIVHYQKIIVALTEMDRIMSEIDKIEIE